MTSASSRGLYVRKKNRVCSSPAAGMKQSWTEYQVIQGRRVISRHDMLTQAQKAIRQLVSSDSAKIASLED